MTLSVTHNFFEINIRHMFIQSCVLFDTKSSPRRTRIEKSGWRAKMWWGINALWRRQGPCRDVLLINTST
jgi:hypothetical protein